MHGRRQHVWLPGSGVWAALPASAEPTGASGSKERRRGSKKRSRELTEQPADDALRQEPAAGVAPGVAAEAAKPPETARPHYTGFELQQDKDASDVEDAEEHPTCPICLVDIIELSEKAVVTTCMHTFCHSCIDRWLSHHKRICPLCKQRVSSVIYDITPAGTYKEREVPPSPKLATAGSSQGDGDSGLPLLQRLQDFLGVAGLLDPYEQQQLRQERGRGSGGSGGAQRLRTEAGSGRPGSRRGAAPASSAAAGSSQAGPRPYFWRLQQRLQAGAYRPGGIAGGTSDGAAGDGPVSEHDYVLLWRRQIYDQDLWAVPVGSEPAHISLGSGSARERRLTEWIDRELQALLQTDDTTIVRGFVMGLLVAYGLEPFGSDQQATSGQPSSNVGGASSAAAAAATASRRAAEMVAAAQRGRGIAGVAGGAGSGAGASRPGSSGGAAGASGGSGVGFVGGSALSSSPQDALQPFLHEHAEHFWHELRCFATAPYTVATYDRMVTYLQRQPQPAQPAQAGPAARGAAAAGGGSHAGAGRASRWDQRQRGAASQPAAGQPARQRQQRWGSRAVQPARVVLQVGQAGQQRRQEERAEAYQPAPDAEVPRRTAVGVGGDTRNPSPPPLGRAAIAARMATQQPPPPQQQQQQAQEAQQPAAAATVARVQAAQPASAGKRRGRSRSRSPSRGRRQRWRRSRSRSRSTGRQRRRGRSSRSRSHSQVRRRDRREHRHRLRSSSDDLQWRERSHDHGWERHEAACPYGGYIMGDSDGGDRWCML
ncbi:hypothetical protein ABPG75_004256 [Micractinium tetrahymenae]